MYYSFHLLNLSIDHVHISIAVHKMNTCFKGARGGGGGGVDFNGFYCF